MRNKLLWVENQSSLTLLILLIFLMAQGEWNDISEGHSQIMVICEGCYYEI